MATSPNATQITPPRVSLIDERTGAVSREWYRWFYSLYNIVGGGLGIVPVASGGTGLSTIPTNGQLLIGNGTGYTLNTLGVGAGISVTNGIGTITLANTGVLSFSGGTTGLTPSAVTTGAITLAGTLIAVNGGTGFASYVVGDLLYANTTTTLAKLPDVATGNALISGGVGVAPSWGKIGLTTHVSGVLPIANGGTNGSATPTAGAVPYGTGTSYGFTAAGTTGQVLTSAGAGVPTWTTPTTGTVTSVGLAMPTQFTVTNSPVTSTGTLTAAWNTQTANFVLAGPTTGAAAVPTFRALVAADVPGSALTKTDDTNVTLTLGGSPTTALLNAASLTLGWSGQLAVGRGGTGLSAGTSGGVPYFSSTSAMTSSGLLTQYGVVYGGGAGASPVATAAGTTGQVLTATTGGAPTWAAPATSGTVTSVSVVSANGFAGTVATATTTPAITLTTSITGVLKGNGTAISAAVVNTDYFAPSAPVTKTADFTVAATEVWLINNKSGSTCTVTLPTASSWTGRVLRFQNYQVQAVVSASSNVVPLAGGAAGTSILLASSGDSATLVSDGSNWLMTQYIPNNILLLE
jgi:hypothetical protein